MCSPANDLRRWYFKPFISGSVTPSNRGARTFESKMCANCGSVSIIGGDLLVQSRKQDRFFCDIQCAGEYKKHHNHTAAYKKKWADSDYAKQLESQAKAARVARERAIKDSWRCCSWCGKAKRGLAKWCSGGGCRRERNAFESAMSRGGYDSGEVICKQCGRRRHFNTHASLRKHCSRKCSQKAARKDKDKTRQRRLTLSSKMVRPMSLERLFKRDKRTCQICGCKCVVATGANLENEGTKDHIIPLAEGGLDDARNTRLACRACNTRKGASVEPGSQFLLPLGC